MSQAPIPPSSGPGPSDSMPPEVTADDKTMGMLAHLLGILGFIGPLIIWLIKKDTSAFVAEEGKEALNFQITLLIAWAVVIVITAITCGFGGVLAPVVMIVSVIFSIMGALQAQKGEHYKYPFAIRLIQ